MKPEHSPTCRGFKMTKAYVKEYVHCAAVVAESKLPQLLTFLSYNPMLLGSQGSPRVAVPREFGV